MSSNRFDKIPASAFVVLNKKGRVLAKVVIKYPNDGAGTLYAMCETWGKDGDGPYEVKYSKAGGYGYDKKAAALSDFTIAGHRLADHCGYVEAPAMKRAAQLLKQQLVGRVERDYRKLAEKIGFRFTNWHTDSTHPKGGYYLSVYPEPGLSRLEMLGYRVVQAL